MKQFKIAALFVCVVFPLLAGAAPDEYVLSLHQCIEYAGTHSGTLKIKDFEQGIAREKVAESVGAALPQINASGTVDDNEIVATQLLPGEILGQPGTFVPVKFGTEIQFQRRSPIDANGHQPGILGGLEDHQNGCPLGATECTKNGRTIDLFNQQTLLSNTDHSETSEHPESEPGSE